jgi:hypothetical protein
MFFANAEEWGLSAEEKNDCVKKGRIPGVFYKMLQDICLDVIAATRQSRSGLGGGLGLIVQDHRREVSIIMAVDMGSVIGEDTLPGCRAWAA